MNPIFNEYITFLEHHQVDIKKINLTEGYYWLDKTIIKAYNKKTYELIKIARIYTDNNLNLTYKIYKEPTPQLEELES